jgi:hypothetical protein
MQNAKCEMQSVRGMRCLNFAFCILHFEFRLGHFQQPRRAHRRLAAVFPSGLADRRPRVTGLSDDAFKTLDDDLKAHSIRRRRDGVQGRIRVPGANRLLTDEIARAWPARSDRQWR